MNARFTAQDGIYRVTLECRRYKAKRWKRSPLQLHFVLAGAVQQTALRFQERLIEAVHSPERGPALKQAGVPVRESRPGPAPVATAASGGLAKARLLRRPAQYCQAPRPVVD